MTPEKYKKLREKLGLTQARLAARLGITRKTVNRRESGEATITTEAKLAIKHLCQNASISHRDGNATPTAR